jgi:hypothetical protein
VSGTCELTDVAEEEGPSSTKLVIRPGGEWETGDTSNGLDGVENSEERTGRVTEVFLPIGDRLKTCEDQDMTHSPVATSEAHHSSWNHHNRYSWMS